MIMDMVIITISDQNLLRLSHNCRNQMLEMFSAGIYVLAIKMQNALSFVV